MDPILASCPIAKASLEQFAGAVCYAGEIVCNIFVAGGSAVTLRLGSYVKGQDPTTGQLVENFAPNAIDRATDEITMEAVCEVDPGQGFKDVNPFSSNLWQLSKGGRAVTIAEAMGDKFAKLPAYEPVSEYFVVPFYSNQAMFLMRKHVCSIFAVAVNRGAQDLGLLLRRGREISESVMVQKLRKIRKQVPEKKRGPDGNLVFTEASDAEGKPIFDPIFDRGGRPMFDPRTGEIRRQRRLNYVVEMVEREVDEIYSEEETLKRTALYLLVAKSPAIGQDDFLQASATESSYDPTWMLADVLSGACRDKQPFHGMGTGT